MRADIKESLTAIARNALDPVTGCGGGLRSLQAATSSCLLPCCCGETLVEQLDKTKPNAAMQTRLPNPHRT